MVLLRPWAWVKPYDVFRIIRDCGVGRRPPRDQKHATGAVPGERPREAPMDALVQDYLPVVVFIGIATVIGLALLVSPFLVAFSMFLGAIMVVSLTGL